MAKKVVNYEAWLLERRSIDPETGCWNYVNPKGGKKIGGLVIDGHGVNADQISAMIYLGHQPDGTMTVCVCHHCDNPRCFNPEHLFLGSQSDNCKDRSRKGRGRENRQDGEDNPHAKLNAADVEEIRAAHAAGESQTSIAQRYDVVQPHISRIVHGEQWIKIREE